MDGTNPSGIKPLEYGVLVKQIEVEARTKGGLILPDEQRDRQQWAEQRARVIAVSPDAFAEFNSRVEPGEMVIIAKHAGGVVKGDDGEEYRIIKDRDILGVMRHE